MESIQLALDWTPNVNHIGFFVAKQKGFYSETDLEVNLISPAEDDYALTPAKKVALGKADFALCPMESILSYRTKEIPFGLKAIAAIYQDDLSAIVSLKEAGITSPKDLDGKSYASYQAKYEDEIVKQMIINDGGKGNIDIYYPSKLGIWETIIKGDHDSTWIFLNWEGVQAKGKEIELSTFKMRDFEVPYSYSPVLAASEEQVKSRAKTYKKFLEATKQGFLFAAKNKAEAEKILSPWVSESDADIDIKAALDLSSPSFGDHSNWGRIDPGNVKKYLDWIYNKGLEKVKVTVDDLLSTTLMD
ncbi:MAG: ABC transporter substrate-binding protein [Bacteroidota bacterium]